MTMQLPTSRLRVLILALDDTLCQMLRELMELEGFDVAVVQRASEVLAIVEHSHGKHIVLMDNYHASREAQTVTKTVFAWPGLHRRVRVMGLATRRHEHVRLDAFVELPFTVAELLNAIERACTELEAMG